MTRKNTRAFRLGDFTVEPEIGHVAKGEWSFHLSPTAMAVLVYLAGRPGELSTRDQIASAVWGLDFDGGHTEALTRAISEIRSALNDNASAPQYVKTARSQGYTLLVWPEAVSHDPHISPMAADRDTTHFWSKLVRHGVAQAGMAYLVAGWVILQVAEVTFNDIGLPAWSEQFVTFVVIGGFPVVILLSWFLEFADGKLRLDKGDQCGGFLNGLEGNYLTIFAAYFIAGLGAMAYQVTVGFESSLDNSFELTTEDSFPVSPNSLAVLRLATFGADARLNPLSEGLSEDLIDALAKVPGLSVSSRGDSWSLEPNSRSETVLERLRVSHFVEGSLRFLDSETLRVVVQLVDSQSGFHIVSRGFDFVLDNYASVPPKIIQVIASNLRLGLGEVDGAKGFYTHQAATVDSYIMYRRGLHETYKPASNDSIEAAIGYFLSALSIDSNYPAAHAGICRAHVHRYELNRASADIEAAETACSKALAVAPRLPMVLSAVGDLYLATGRYEDARSAYQMVLQQDGRFVSAITGMARIATWEGKFSEAESLIRQSIALQPGNWRLINNLAGLYFDHGMFHEAAREYEKSVLLGTENFVVMGNLGAARLMSGDFQLAQSKLEQSLSMQFDALVATNLGIVQYFLGDYMSAVKVFRSVAAHSPGSSAVHIALADALYFSEEADLSSAAYERARNHAAAELAVNSENPETLAYWAWAEAMMGDEQSARSAIDKVLRLAPNDPYSFYYLALVEVRAGNPRKAEQALDMAEELGYPKALLSNDPFFKSLLDKHWTHRWISGLN